MWAPNEFRSLLKKARSSGFGRTATNVNCVFPKFRRTKRRTFESKQGKNAVTWNLPTKTVECQSLELRSQDMELTRVRLANRQAVSATSP